MRLEARADSLVLEQRLEDAFDPLCGTERLLQPRAAPAGGDDRQLPGLDVAEPPLVERDRDAGREKRLADDESPAPSDLDDDSVRQCPCK